MRGLFSPVPTQTMFGPTGRRRRRRCETVASLVELMLEGDAVVDRLEQPAGGGGDPVGGRVGLEDGDGGDAAAHGRRADAPPGQRLDPVGVERAVRRAASACRLPCFSSLSFLVSASICFSSSSICFSRVGGVACVGTSPTARCR